jgi:hypothetical protein
VELLRTREGGGDRYALELRVASHMIQDGVALQLELVLVVDVLPLAACARAEVWTRRSYPVGRRTCNLDDDGRHHLLAPTFVSDDPRDDLLAGYPSEDVDSPSGVPGVGVPERGQALQSESRELIFGVVMGFLRSDVLHLRIRASRVPANVDYRVPL